MSNLIDLNSSLDSSSSIEDSAVGRFSSSGDFNRSFDSRDSLDSRINQLCLDVLETTRSLTSNSSQYREAVDALSQEQQLTRMSSVMVLTDVMPVLKKQSSHSDSIPKEALDKKAQEFVRQEVAAENLRRVSSAVDVLDGFKNFKKIPATVAIVGEKILAGQSIAFDSKQPVEIDHKQVLGVGAQGSVYKGRLCEDLTAVKVFRDDSIQEYTMLARFNHPYIISALAANKTTIHFPLAKGDLNTTWKAKRLEDGLNAEELKIVLKQIAEGTAYLHNQGFVHRDLKPANILIKENGDILIADLGLVDSVQNIGSVEGRRDQMLSGTMEYMAPETYEQPELFQQVTIENCTKRDVWSLGIMMWQLLSNGDKYHPCQPDRVGVDKLVYKNVYGLFKNVKSKQDEGWFRPGELEAQLDPQKTAYYDPEGFLVELMKACLTFDPDERISMENIHTVLEIFSSGSSQQAKSELAKILKDTEIEAIHKKAARLLEPETLSTDLNASDDDDLEDERFFAALKAAESVRI
jgi:serine/threonine protein kinase